MHTILTSDHGSRAPPGGVGDTCFSLQYERSCMKRCCSVNVTRELTKGQYDGPKASNVLRIVLHFNISSCITCNSTILKTTTERLPTFRGKSWHWYGLKLTELVNHRSISSPYISKSPWDEDKLSMSCNGMHIHDRIVRSHYNYCMYSMHSLITHLLIKVIITKSNFLIRKLLITWCIGLERGVYT